MSSLTTAPDIISVVVNWDPPQQGVGHITEYEIRYSLGTSLLGLKQVSGELSSYRVTGLLPSIEYQFEIRAFIESLVGPPEQVTGTTNEIGEGR